MDHHGLRLIQGTPQRRERRLRERRPLRVPGQLVWKDARGATRLARVVTRDVSDLGIAVDCLEGSSIPLYRLVYVQIDRAARESTPALPEPLRRPAVLSAVYRIGPTSEATGLPGSYALRLLVEPESTAMRLPCPDEPSGVTAGRFVRSA